MGSVKDRHEAKHRGTHAGCGCGGRRASARVAAVDGGHRHAEGHAECSGGCRCKVLGRIRDLSRAGMQALDIGSHGEAERLLREALDLGRTVGAGAVIDAKTRNCLGIVLHSAGRMVEALAEYHRALTLIEGRVGVDNRLYRVVAANSRKAVGA
ncbi:tetratricopeptide repeat protein [Desulfocurvus sp.]|jgi:hypothetical protein|uniref:tetratricopeptide repeat protein n=1 Tax=Desulfocurvus sp. TaxID=2871698 RepID=UPI0025C6A281|nr:tetratricopeptide repeat protein [Desulfocurvus sp.]MCK9240457.1 tetratricopeptide repeat protein [Desulfocurvus sp.]